MSLMDGGLSGATRVMRAPNHLSAEVGDQVVLMSVEHGKYVGLDAVGSAVWSRIEQPISVDHLCADLMTAFSAAPEVLRGDVVEFLDELRAHGLIEIVS